MKNAYFFKNKSVLFVSLFLLIFLLASYQASAATNVSSDSSAVPNPSYTVYLFWGEECHVCEEVKSILNEMKGEYPNLKIEEYEVFHNNANRLMMMRMLGERSYPFTGVPVVIIGRSCFSGFSEQSKIEIKNAIKEYCSDTDTQSLTSIPFTPADPPVSTDKEAQGQGSPSMIPEQQAVSDKNPTANQAPSAGKDIKPAIANVQPPAAVTENKQNTIGTGVNINPQPKNPSASTGKSDLINLPLIGEVHALDVSIPFAAIIIALVDSLNPCAFFVLFSLLSLLVHARSRKKIILVGSIFVFASGLIYLIFMAAWLNIFLFMNNIEILTLAAGIIAAIFALINIKDFFLFKQGISLTIPDESKPAIFDKIRKLVRSSSTAYIIFGATALAVTANLYEFLCTAGFPMVFTRILTLNNLPVSSYYFYLILYNIVYVLPLAVIVLIFSATLGKLSISEWQGRVLKLVSGTMMLGLGMILIIKPSILNNLAVSAGILIAAIIAAITITQIFKKHFKS